MKKDPNHHTTTLRKPPPLIKVHPGPSWHTFLCPRGWTSFRVVAKKICIFPFILQTKRGWTSIRAWNKQRGWTFVRGRGFISVPGCCHRVPAPGWGWRGEHGLHYGVHRREIGGRLMLAAPSGLEAKTLEKLGFNLYKHMPAQ